jgi:hypothetical protein
MYYTYNPHRDTLRAKPADDRALVQLVAQTWLYNIKATWKHKLACDTVPRQETHEWLTCRNAMMTNEAERCIGCLCIAAKA